MNEKILEEFDDRLKEFVPTNTDQDIYLLTEDFKAFLSDKLDQARAEERARMVEEIKHENILPVINRDKKYKKTCFCCKKRAIFSDWTGWYFCFKHWRRNYKYGREHGLWQAIKESKIVI